MKPGPELDCLVAERVMGWQYDLLRDAWVKADGGHAYAEVWKPSTDIAAAWEVLEHLRERGWRLVLNPPGYLSDEDWVIEILPKEFLGKVQLVYAPTAPTAICRAALLIALREGGENVSSQDFTRALQKDKARLEDELTKLITEKLNDFQRKWGINVSWIDVNLVELREVDKPHATSVVESVRVQLEL